MENVKKEDNESLLNIVEKENIHLNVDNLEQQDTQKNELKNKNFISLKTDLPLIFSEDFLCDSVKIGKKDIVQYIKGRARQEFESDNFYYAYNYRDDGILIFIAVSGEEHIENRIHMFTKALLEEGEYYYRPFESKNVFFIEHSKEGFTLYTGSVEDVDLETQIDLSVEQQPEKIPSSMLFQWSLKKNSFEINVLLCMGLLFSILVFSFSLFKYMNIDTPLEETQKKFEQVVEASKEKVSIFPDIAWMIDNVSAKVGDRGYVEAVKLKGVEQNIAKIEFTLVFSKQRDAQAFVAENKGAKYENDKVFYTSVTGR